MQGSPQLVRRSSYRTNVVAEARQAASQASPSRGNASPKPHSATLNREIPHVRRLPSFSVSAASSDQTSPPVTSNVRAVIRVRPLNDQESKQGMLADHSNRIVCSNYECAVLFICVSVTGFKHLLLKQRVSNTIMTAQFM